MLFLLILNSGGWAHDKPYSGEIGLNWGRERDLGRGGQLITIREGGCLSTWNANNRRRQKNVSRPVSARGQDV
jgi:hypothetical protein